MGSRLRVVCITGAIAIALGAAASTAMAAMTLGPSPLQQRTSVHSSAGARIFTNAVVPGATLASPIDGVVTRWRVRRGDGPGVMAADTIRLRILRPTGIANKFAAAGTSDPHAVPGASNDPIDVYEFGTSLPIEEGDTIGLGVNVPEVPNVAMTGASFLRVTTNLADGQTGTFATASATSAALFNADVESDANCNGLGDETQEAVVSGGCLPPKPAALAGKRAKAAKAAPIQVTCALPGGDCNGNQISLTAQASKSGAGKRKRVALGSASFSLSAGRSQVVAVPLSKRARKLLKRRKNLTSTVTITGGGAATIATLTLKPKRA